MYLGRIVETAAARDLFAEPRHPYTQALLSAIPVTRPTSRITRRLLPGDPPSPIAPPPGCHLSPRCPHVRDTRSPYAPGADCGWRCPFDRLPHGNAFFSGSAPSSTRYNSETARSSPPCAPEPRSKLRARRGVLQPFVEPRALLRDAPPQPVDQHAPPVPSRRGLVDSLDFDAHVPHLLPLQCIYPDRLAAKSGFWYNAPGGTLCRCPCSAQSC